jgi:hypothetical protein
MKITIESTKRHTVFSRTASVSTDHDDVLAEDLVVLLRQVCLGYGYEPFTVNGMFSDETDNE